MIIISAYGYSQSLTDFVVLRKQSDTLKSDTIYGTVILPHNGVFWNVKIKTASGEKKFKPKEVARIKAQNLYFASIPYGKSYAIVPRILDGEVELYFYYTGSDRLSFISKMQDDFNSDIAYDNHLMISESIWNATSNFYIFNRTTNQFIKITRSSEKFKENISEIFKSNESIYRKIKNGDYKPEQIGQIVKSYNNTFRRL
ncbi:MAG: hypothetical protein IT247_04995 [Bacteroidia bacterium]|nr:hypothetical protein [Bacteroidia bacterium]